MESLFFYDLHSQSVLKLKRRNNKCNEYLYLLINFKSNLICFGGEKIVTTQ